MDIKEEIFNFVSTHEAQVSHDMRKKDDLNIIRFTTFGTRAGCKALYEVIELLDEDTKLKVVQMMQSRRVLS
jgi:hypothetical protein